MASGRIRHGGGGGASVQGFLPAPQGPPQLRQVAAQCREVQVGLEGAEALFDEGRLRRGGGILLLLAAVAPEPVEREALWRVAGPGGGVAQGGDGHGELGRGLAGPQGDDERPKASVQARDAERAPHRGVAADGLRDGLRGRTKGPRLPEPQGARAPEPPPHEARGRARGIGFEDGRRPGLGLDGGEGARASEPPGDEALGRIGEVGPGDGRHPGQIGGQGRPAPRSRRRCRPLRRAPAHRRRARAGAGVKDGDHRWKVSARTAASPPRGRVGGAEGRAGRVAGRGAHAR
mmetsp:Transcript_173822/g.557102  ORF Transcript_173822/g.557102 Transcript_173822/m.557102 type:complete len:290 (+) Transcript_173822:117-986(+)